MVTRTPERLFCDVDGSWPAAAAITPTFSNSMNASGTIFFIFTTVSHSKLGRQLDELPARLVKVTVGLRVPAQRSAISVVSDDLVRTSDVRDRQTNWLQRTEPVEPQRSHTLHASFWIEGGERPVRDHSPASGGACGTLNPGAALAQDTTGVGAISGIVRDASGNVAEGVRVVR